MEESPSPPSHSPPSLAHLRLHGTPPGLEKGSLSLKKISTSSLSATRTPRINRKVEKRRDAFGLGSEEVFLDDYLCAIKKRMLHQGRMYVFDRHVCFHGNTFGHHEYYTIPFSEVTSMTKETNVGFPNSIRVKWGDHDSLFFTSFINREDAYDLLRYQWRKNCSLAPSPEPDEESRSSGQGDTSFTKPVKRLLTTIGLRTDGSSSSEIKRIQSSHELAENEDFETVSDDQMDKTIDLSFLEGNGKAPPKDPDAHRTVDFTLPCTTKEFWVRFLSNKSSFFKEFHERRGDTDVEVTAWQKHSHEGMVRDMQFVTPLKMKMGPPTTLCCQSQQCIVISRWDVTPEGDHSCRVVIHTSIPFHKAKKELEGKSGGRSSPRREQDVASPKAPAPQTPTQREAPPVSKSPPTPTPAAPLSGLFLSTLLLGALILLQIALFFQMRASNRADERRASDLAETLSLLKLALRQHLNGTGLPPNA
ncbi:hypothetical protein QBZ16_001139 [Prototheca wickerhamii]|uniref:VASt domain-containing protein n=1 Tax=Prototheca wickerhamii TaxID=3111 RepID=A0AAD9IHA6_PROWI|nr:hypothetical protein QBZ16_001139 [Prototheca wickerhamii]